MLSLKNHIDSTSQDMFVCKTDESIKCRRCCKDIIDLFIDGEHYG